MVDFFDHVCLPGSSAHIFIEAEGLGTSALPCTMQLETGDRRTGHAERRGNHSPDSFSYRFLLLTRKELDATVCVWSMECKASLSNPSLLGSMLV